MLKYLHSLMVIKLEEERDSQLESTTKLSSGDMSIEFATPSYDYNAKNEFKDCDS
jgi:hypothetical protein